MVAKFIGGHIVKGTILSVFKGLSPKNGNIHKLGLINRVPM